MVKKYFGQAPIDEILLKNEAQKLIKSTNYFDATSLAKINTDYGVELATMALYLYLCNNEHKDFINEINSYPDQLIKSEFTTLPKIFVVPGLSYLEHPEMGGNGKIIKEIGALFGNQVEVIQIKSKGSLLENSQIIQQTILSDKSNSLWIVSLSKGSAETRLFLERNRHNFAANIKGWIDLSGIFNGTMLADLKLDNIYKKCFYKILLPFFKTSYQGLDELRESCSYWSKKFEPIGNFDIIHVAGFPLMSHINSCMIKKYKILAKLGPNDGMIKLSNLFNYPGKIYPVWGVDHMMRIHHLSSLWYKLFHYVNKTTTH
jgi:hypothetical protein